MNPRFTQELVSELPRESPHAVGETLAFDPPELPLPVDPLAPELPEDPLPVDELADDDPVPVEVWPPPVLVLPLPELLAGASTVKLTVVESASAPVPAGTDHCSTQLPTAEGPIVPEVWNDPLELVLPSTDVEDFPFWLAVTVTGALGAAFVMTTWNSSPWSKTPPDSIDSSVVEFNNVKVGICATEDPPPVVIGEDVDPPLPLDDAPPWHAELSTPPGIDCAK
jgi:hypothetical protein